MAQGYRETAFFGGPVPEVILYRTCQIEYLLIENQASVLRDRG